MNVQVKVKPNAKKQQLITEPDGNYTAHLRSSPIDGKANVELIQLLAKSFSVPRSAITIKLGLSSRTKLVVIETNRKA